MALFLSARLPPLWRPGFDSRPGHVNPRNSCLEYRWNWSSLFNPNFLIQNKRTNLTINKNNMAVAKWLTQCCGSMTFWCGSGSGCGSADPCLWLMDLDLDPDPNPFIFIIELQDTNKKQILKKNSADYLLKVPLLHHFTKVKTKSQNSRNQGFPYYFSLMIEGSGSGSIPLTNGSGSGSRRPKNTWIRIRIRILNTGLTFNGSSITWTFQRDSPGSSRTARRREPRPPPPGADRRDGG